MKNTKFSKKALLSSIAMLLVALVALGSATFAWFTANPTVDATGLKLNASTAAGLAVLSDTEKTYYTTLGTGIIWDYDTILNCKPDAQETAESVTLPSPISFNYDGTGVSFMTTVADDEDNYAAADVTAATASTNYYSEKIYLKSTVAGQTATVLSAIVDLDPVAAEAMAATVRVLLVDESNAVIGTWNSDGNANKYITTGPALSDADFVASADNSKLAMNKVVDASGTKYVTAYIFIDGEDDACKTTNVTNLADIMNGVNISFSTLA